MNEEQIFLLFTNCKVVSGAKRSILCDLQRGTFDFMPNGLAEILEKCRDKSILEIKKFYNNEFDSVIEEYFEFLISREYGFLVDKEESWVFPDMDMNWCTPSLITHSIIDINESSQHNFKKIFVELEDLGCRDVQIRFYCGVEREKIEYILNELAGSRIKSVELLMAYTAIFSFEEILELTVKYARIRNIIVHSSPEFSLAKINETNGRGNIIYVPEIIDSSAHCGIISPSNFVINQPTFMESQRFNSCLNGKISIDVKGNIKNCPSMERSYGNIGVDSLKGVSLSEEFKSIWNMNKDQIEVCKDCEFRHICTDCRAFLNDSHSKSSKCNYNPYTTKWEN